jgi:hypothetical protein
MIRDCCLSMDFHAARLRFCEGMAETKRMLQSPRNMLHMTLALFLILPVFCYGQNSARSKIADYLSKKAYAIPYSIFREQPAPPPGLMPLLAHQAKWDEMARGDLNSQAPYLQFERIDDSASEGGGGVARYRVLAAGVPENKVFAFGLWPAKSFVLDPASAYAKEDAAGNRDIYVNAQGLLMTRMPKPNEEESLRAVDELVVMPATERAEPVRYLLESKDGEVQAFGTLVPHPATAEDKGCRIEARIAQPASTALLIIMDGFPAKAKISVVLESEGEVANATLTADANGHAVTADFPYVAGKAQGVVNATAEGRNCLPSVEVPWGATAQPAAKTP